MKEQDKQLSRRAFIQQSTAVGAGILLAGPADLFAAIPQEKGAKMNIKSKGYAAHDASGTLSPWEFERRPVGERHLDRDQICQYLSFLYPSDERRLGAATISPGPWS